MPSPRFHQSAFEHEDVAMSAKKPVADDKHATTVVLKRIGGSQSDDWNNILGNQALQALWIKHSEKEERDRQYGATIAGLIGISPKDERHRNGFDPLPPGATSGNLTAL
jgi:hypothetical protein